MHIQPKLSEKNRIFAADFFKLKILIKNNIYGNNR